MSKKNAVASIVRNLPAVGALQELWQPRTADGETEDEYWAFISWLDRGRNRGTPEAQWQTAARRWDWAGRALAYERAEALSRNDGAGLAPAQEIADNLTQMLRIETKKLVERSAKETGETITVKDMVATLNAITEIHKETVKARKEAVDYSCLSQDELRTYLAISRKLQDGAGKK